MKKKGFTLVELLAVIAILAILVILALPNVMGMYQNAQKNSFVTELQSIVSTAETQFVNDSMNMSGDAKGIVYARIGGVTLNKGDNDTFPKSQITTPELKQLELQGTTSIDFYLEFNLAGKIIAYYATDKRFQFAYEGDGLAAADIVSVPIKTGADCKGDGKKLTALKLNLQDNADINRNHSYNSGVVTISDATEYCNEKSFTKITIKKVTAEGKPDKVKVAGEQVGHVGQNDPATT